MSKKKLLAVILPCVLVLILAAVFLIVYFCYFASDLYSELNAIANANHNSIKVTITTQQNEEKIESIFDIKNSGNRSVINYSVENFSPIDPDTGAGGDTVASVGSVVLENGKVTEQTGDQVNVNFGNVMKLSLHFAERNFQNVQTENGIFSAKVTNPQSFMDAPSLVCTNMTVMFAYTGSAENVIVIQYTSAGGAAVTINYTFS